MFRNDRSQQAPLDSFLLAYQPQLMHYPLEVPNSIIALFYWLPGNDKRLYASFQQTVTTLIREGRPATQQDGPANMCKGRTLADDSYQAKLAVPLYQSEGLRQGYFNSILTGLAHLKTTRPGDGWREYDEVQLLRPADYDGPAD